MITAAPKRKPRPRLPLRTPLPLENGENLHVTEFLRRDERTAEVKKAQLIEGIVYVPSPVRANVHGKPDNLIQGWLFTYTTLVPGVDAYTNATLVLDLENAPQPDAILCSTPRKGGRVWLNDKGYLCGASELVCEVAASSSSIDLHDKMRAYCRNGIAEYLVWLTAEKRILWFVLEDAEFVPQSADGRGLLHSRIFPGLVLDTKALLKHDGARVLEALRPATKK